MNGPLVCRLPLVVGYWVRSYSSAFLVGYNGLAPLGEYSGAASWAPESGKRCSWGN